MGGRQCSSCNASLSQPYVQKNSRALSLFRGEGHSYYLLALRLQDYMGFAMEASTEWRIGGTHSRPTALILGISAPPPPPHTHIPIISELFVWDWEGAQKCFILRDQTTVDLKSYHLQARVTLTALSVPPRPHFLSAELLCG